MQFREQGKKIQCIRSTYDPASKLSHQKVVGAFDRWADKLPSAGLEELNDTERQELATWFDARQSAKAEHPKPKRERPALVALPGQADLGFYAGTPDFCHITRELFNVMQTIEALALVTEFSGVPA